MAERSSTRLNNFTDAAFAFALTLLVVSSADRANDLAEISGIIQQLPGYLGAFAIIALFWSAHVNWSRRDGMMTVPNILLTLSLIFIVLIFVYPLRTLAQTAGEFLMGNFDAIKNGTVTDARRLFAFYGIGFAGLSAIIAALNFGSRRAGRIADADDTDVVGDIVIWSFIAGCGIVSALLALLSPDGLAGLAPWTYFFIPFFVLFWNFWSGKRGKSEDEGDGENLQED